MGCYTWIRTYLPETAFSNAERDFLAELRRLLPDDAEWRMLSHDERLRRQEEVHIRLHIDQEAYGVHLVKQWQREGVWYVGDPFPGLPCPPFPRLLIESPALYRNQYGLSAAWQVAFSASSRWVEHSSIYQTLSDSRRHCHEVFAKILALFWADEQQVKSLEHQAPPGSDVHRKLRSVFRVFDFVDYVDLHTHVLARELPAGAILELDLGEVTGYLASYEDEAARELGKEFNLARNRTADVETKYAELKSAVIFRSDRLRELLDKVGRFDVPALVADTTLDGVESSTDAIEAWLLLRDGYYTDIAHYLFETN